MNRKTVIRGGNAARLLAGILLAMAACSPETEDNLGLAMTGKPIVFGASTSYSNGAGTRTEYSGEKFNANGSDYERIDWTPAYDRIRILCKAAGKGPVSDYAVNGTATAANQVSKAGIQPANGNGLLWGSTDAPHYFYAVYPAPGTKSNHDETKVVSSSDVSITQDSGDDTKATIKGKIPGEQDYVKVEERTVSGGKIYEYKPNMNHAYMYASASKAAGAGGEITLSFSPLVTTFEIRLKAGDADAAGATVKKILLRSSSTNLAGSFTASLSHPLNGTETCTPSIDSSPAPTKAVWMEIPTAGRRTLSTNDYLMFTLFALPTDQTDLTLELTLEKNGVTLQRNLELKYRENPADPFEPIVAHSCNKTYINSLSIPGGIYYIEGPAGGEIVINGYDGGSQTGTLQSYRKTASGQTYTDVVFQYSEDGESWADNPPPGLSAISLTNGATAISKTITATTGSYKVLDYTEWDTESAARVAALNHPISCNCVNCKSRTRELTSTDYSPLGVYDLSMHTITGGTRSRGQAITSNCYVVHAAGDYIFPMVYGNGFDYRKQTVATYAAEVLEPRTAGNPNDKVYRIKISSADYTGGNSAAYNKTDFKRFDGANFSSAYIPMSALSQDGGSANYEAFVLWQDTTDPDFIHVNWRPESASNFWPLDCWYIRFQIPEGHAREGNAIIGLRSKVAFTTNGKTWPAGTIIWSWHIWVTAQNMNPVTVNTYANGTTVATTSNQMMPVHLGWCIGTEETWHYKDRVYYVKASQDVILGGKSTVFQVIQRGGSDSYSSPASATCYQWGRKDPFLPGSYHNNKHHIAHPSYPIEETSAYLKSRAPTEGDEMAESIRYPHMLFDPFSNIATVQWDAGATTTDVDRKATKTVYDPCPPEYCVPHRYAFSIFNKDGASAPILNGPPAAETILKVNAIDQNGDNSITSADYILKNGWYFKKNTSDTQGIYFPSTIGRWGNGEARYYDVIYLWTACRDDNTNFYNFLYTKESARPWHSGASAALTVHPIKE